MKQKNSSKKENSPNQKKNIIQTISHPVSLPTTFGQRAADKVTQIAGSWGFILFFAGFLVLWVIINTSWLIFGEAWDPRPFILLNLILSCLAAFQAPIILMSQNRQSQKDRQRAEYDYAVNRKAEKEIQEIRKAINRVENKITPKRKK